MNITGDYAEALMQQIALQCWHNLRERGILDCGAIELHDIKNEIWGTVIETTSKAEAEERHQAWKQKPTKRPIEVRQTIQAKYGKEYYDCLVLELDNTAITIRWSDGSQRKVSRAMVRRSPGESGPP